jgi:hypothetical protein
MEQKGHYARSGIFVNSKVDRTNSIFGFGGCLNSMANHNNFGTGEAGKGRHSARTGVCLAKGGAHGKTRPTFSGGRKACEDSMNFRAGESGVALHFPPQSMTLVDWRWSAKFAKRPGLILGCVFDFGL